MELQVNLKLKHMLTDLTDYYNCSLIIADLECPEKKSTSMHDASQFRRMSYTIIVKGFVVSCMAGMGKNRARSRITLDCFCAL